MRVIHIFSAALMMTSLLVGTTAFAVNEHSEPSEAADRAAILKSEKTGKPISHPLNVPDPGRDPVNTAGAHTNPDATPSPEAITK